MNKSYEEILKEKLNSLIQSCMGIKDIYESFVKELKSLQNEKNRLEKDISKIKEDWKVTIQQKEQWLAEFESNIKKEKEEISKEKSESKSMISLAKDEKEKADKLINDISKKRNELDIRILETDKLKREYETKLEKIKAMAQQV